VSFALAELVPTVPVIVAVVSEETGAVETVKDPVVAPLNIETDAGTVAEAFDDLRLTVTPLTPAFAERVTVPFDETPPTTVVGARTTLVTVCAALLVESASTTPMETTKLRKQPIVRPRPRRSNAFCTLAIYLSRPCNILNQFDRDLGKLESEIR